MAVGTAVFNRVANRVYKACNARVVVLLTVMRAHGAETSIMICD